MVVPFLAAILSSPVYARTWHILVDGTGAAPTIQAGIDSAAVGDTVLVGPGIYAENIAFLGKAIYVVSSAGPEATTILGDGSGAVVTFDQDEGRSSLLRGLTISGGERGILVSGAEPVIQGNTIRDNGPRGGVTVMYYPMSSGARQRRPRIEDNDVTSNYSNGGGGGLDVQGFMAPEVVRNVINANVTSRGDGGGIRVVVTEGGAVISQNVIRGNRADDHGGGMDLSIVSSSARSQLLEVSENVIVNNIAYGNDHFENSGGGVCCHWTSGPIRNNTFIGNAGYGGGWFGGNLAIGSYSFGPVQVEVYGNIIAASESGGGIGAYSGATVYARDNLFWDNAPQDVVSSGAGVVIEEGSFYVDPLLCDSGDGSVASQSPALSSVAGVIGAIAIPGCAQVPTTRTTWGRLKARY